MKTSLKKTSFIKILLNVQKALSSRSTLPVLNGILLESKNNKLTAYSTDLEIFIKDEVEAMVEKEGRVVVFGNLLVDLVKSLDDGKITLFFEENDKKLVVKSNSSEFSLNTLPAEDYPSFTEIINGKKLGIVGKNLIEAAKQVGMSSSRDESRPVLTGILLESNTNETQIVATDSYRLSIKKISEGNNEEIKPLIIPRRAIEEIVKIINKEDMIEVLFSENQIVFKNDNMIFTSRLIGGQYPNYEQLFPKNFEVEVVVNKEDLLSSSKRMALLSPSTPIVFKIDKSKITVLGKSAEIGSGLDTVAIEGKSKEMEIAFNSRYLIEGLQSISEEKVLLQLVDSFQPGLMRGAENKDYKYLIMPVRLN